MKARGRSRSYPVLPLAEAVELAKRVEQGYGRGPFDRGTLALAVGSKGLTGTSARKIAALGHYGLLERQGAAWVLSDRAVRLMRPLPGEAEALLRGCIFSVPVFAEVISAQQPTGALPAALEVLLQRHHGILPESATEVAAILTASLRHAGMLDEAGRFTPEPGQEASYGEGEGAAGGAEPVTTGATEVPPPAPGYVTIELPEPPVRVVLPALLSAQGAERVRAWLEKVVVAQLPFLQGDAEPRA